MTPKEKAIELLIKYQDIDTYNEFYIYHELSKELALIAVDEILQILPKSEYLEDKLESVKNRQLIYWQQVKTEIEKL